MKDAECVALLQWALPRLELRERDVYASLAPWPGARGTFRREGA